MVQTRKLRVKLYTEKPECRSHDHRHLGQHRGIGRNDHNLHQRLKEAGNLRFSLHRIVDGALWRVTQNGRSPTNATKFQRRSVSHNAFGCAVTTSDFRTLRMTTAVKRPRRSERIQDKREREWNAAERVIHDPYLWLEIAKLDYGIFVALGKITRANLYPIDPLAAKVAMLSMLKVDGSILLVQWALHRQRIIRVSYITALAVLTQCIFIVIIQMDGGKY